MPIPLGILAVAGAGAAGGASSFDLLETTVLSSAASSVTFSSLGSYSDYKHLQLRISTRTDRSGNLSAPTMRLNSDTGSNYAYHLLRGSGSSVLSEGYSSQSSINIPSNSSDYMTANVFSAAVIDILDFSSSSKKTTIRVLGGNPDSNYWNIALQSGLWNNTAAVTSIILEPGFGASNWKASSRFSLYGVK